MYQHLSEKGLLGSFPDKNIRWINQSYIISIIDYLCQNRIYSSGII